MDAVWYGIADFAKVMFKFLPPIGALTNWFFGISIAIGVVYWLYYDAKVRRGGDNYMANKGE